MHEKRVTEAKKTARQICRTARGFISTIVLCFLPSPSDIQRLPMLHRFKLGLLMAIAKPCDDYAVQKHHQTRAISDQKGKPAMGNLLTAGVGLCCKIDTHLKRGQ